MPYQQSRLSYYFVHHTEFIQSSPAPMFFYFSPTRGSRPTVRIRLSAVVYYNHHVPLSRSDIPVYLINHLPSPIITRSHWPRSLQVSILGIVLYKPSKQNFTAQCLRTYGDRFAADVLRLYLTNCLTRKLIGPGVKGPT
jgi:hypothetical protein